MIVLYLKHNNQFMQAIPGFPEIKEEGNKLCFANGKVIINDLSKAGYGFYVDQEIKVPTEWNEELEMEVELPVTLDELNLIEFVPEPVRNLGAEIDELKSRVGKLEIKGE